MGNSMRKPAMGNSIRKPAMGNSMRKPAQAMGNSVRKPWETVTHAQAMGNSMRKETGRMKCHTETDEKQARRSEHENKYNG